MTALGIALTGFGVVLVWSGAKGVDVRNVIKDAFTGKGKPGPVIEVPGTVVHEGSPSSMISIVTRKAAANAAANTINASRGGALDGGALDVSPHPYVSNGTE